jgi:hypothetical protein
MLKVTVNLKGAKIKSEKLINDIKSYSEKQQLIAIKRWLINVLRHTPTYTGTARGTYAPIGRIVGHSVRMGQIRGNIASAKRKKYVKWGGVKYPTGFAAGANYSQHRISKRSTKDKLFFYFNFDQRLPYVLWNEMHPTPPGFTLPSNPPWWALKSGNNSYRRYARGPMTRGFPKIASRLIRLRLTA